MLVIEIDVIGAKTFQTALHRFTDRLRAAVEDQMIAAVLNAAFAGKKDLVAEGFDSFSDNFLIVSGCSIRRNTGVALCGIKQGVAEIVCGFNHLCTILNRHRCAACVGDTHAPKTDGRYFVRSDFSHVHL